MSPLQIFEVFVLGRHWSSIVMRVDNTKPSSDPRPLPYDRSDVSAPLLAIEEEFLLVSFFLPVCIELVLHSFNLNSNVDSVAC